MYGKPPNIRIPDTSIEINDEEIAYNQYLPEDLTRSRYLCGEKPIAKIRYLKWLVGVLALIIIVIFLTFIQQKN